MEQLCWLQLTVPQEWPFCLTLPFLSWFAGWGPWLENSFRSRFLLSLWAENLWQRASKASKMSCCPVWKKSLLAFTLWGSCLYFLLLCNLPTILFLYCCQPRCSFSEPGVLLPSVPLEGTASFSLLLSPDENAAILHSSAPIPLEKSLSEVLPAVTLVMLKWPHITHIHEAPRQWHSEPPLSALWDFSILLSSDHCHS